jgi:hypothetical protein
LGLNLKSSVIQRTSGYTYIHTTNFNVTTKEPRHKQCKIIEKQCIRLIFHNKVTKLEPECINSGIQFSLKHDKNVSICTSKPRMQHQEHNNHIQIQRSHYQICSHWHTCTRTFILFLAINQNAGKSPLTTTTKCNC